MRSPAVRQSVTVEDLPAGAADAPVKTYYASRAKTRRGLYLIAAALLVGAFLVWKNPRLDPSSVFDMTRLALTFTVLIAVLAQGIERLFSRLPSLVVRPSGLVLMPRRQPDGVLEWADIRSIDVYRFGKRVRSRPFFTIRLDDPEKISRHLPLLQRLAFAIDRRGSRVIFISDQQRYFADDTVLKGGA